MRRAGLVLAVVAALLLAAYLGASCGGGDDAAPPSPPARPDLVTGAAADYGPITIRAGHREATVTGAIRGEVVPLHTARVFEADEPLPEYGLDRPLARIRFLRRDGGAPVVLTVGAENFDGSAYYVQRQGDDAVYLVLDDQLDPALTLVGAAAGTGQI